MKQIKGQIEERGYWGSKTEFILAVAGIVIGLGNVWRFLYLCYKNGRGAFLIPYLVFVVTSGVPLFLLETAMGQYTQEGPITCWHRLCPLAEGIGYAGQLILLYNCMYIIILAWVLFYLIFSFNSQLPLASCDNTWNTDAECCLSLEVLRRSVRSTGRFFCLIAVWIIMLFLHLERSQIYGQVVHFTATFPYVMLLVLLIHGLALPGALKGVVFYLYPDPACLSDPQHPSKFVGMESIITSVMDMFPMFPNGCRETFLLLFCLSCFFGQLIMVTELFDNYACNGACILFLSVFESLVMGWIFGAERMFDIIEDMTRSRPNYIFMLCWKYLTPLVSLVSFVYSMVEYKPLTFNRWYRSEPSPWTARQICITFTQLIISLAPLVYS